MSGLVFVRDAEGRPLMPMSAAYARALVHQGKAQVIPHPAVSTIQLTHVVNSPTLRPVVMGLALNAKTVDITIIIEQARALPTSFHLVIDLRVPVSDVKMRRRWAVDRRPHHRSSHIHVHSDLWRYSSVLSMVITACRQLIPISHLVLFPSSRPSALSPVRASWIGRQIQHRFRNIPFTQQGDHEGEHPSGRLIQTLVNSLNLATSHPPNVVVCVLMERWKVFQERTASRSRREPQPQSMTQARDYLLKYRGRLATIRQGRHTMTGIIQRQGPFGQLIVWMPKHVADDGIEWETILITKPAMIHLWPPTSVLMLPMTNARLSGERLR